MTLTLLILGLRGLSGLLARADRDAFKAQDPFGTVCAIAGLDHYPAGALTALAAGDDRAAEWCTRIDPVHLSLDADAVRIITGDRLAITDDEAGALRAWLAEQAHVVASAATPAHWYAHAPRFSLPPPALALGRPIDELLPRGDAAHGLRRWMNGMQMVLHAHPVNDRRRDRGEPPVNTLWPWGGGTAPVAIDWPYAATYGDDPALHGLALAGGSSAAAVPAGFALTGADAFVWLEAPDRAALERDWLAPAFRALGRGLDRLVVFDGAGARYTLTPAMRWRFWRRNDGLETH